MTDLEKTEWLDRALVALACISKAARDHATSDPNTSKLLADIDMIASKVITQASA